MKRAFLVLLCVVLAFSFCACKSGRRSAHGVDIAYFVDMGKVPETNYKIGYELPNKETIENNSMILFENEVPPFFTDGPFNYYYNSAEKPVITKIIGFDECLGFETGAISIEVTDALDSQNIKYTERAPKDGELFFLPVADNRFVIECRELKYSLIFVFENNALCATVLGE